MMILRNLILLVCVLALNACDMLPSLPSLDEVLPDKRTKYRKSKDLPRLEVPPDLTVTEGEYAAAIPGEEESSSLLEFEKRRNQKKRGGGAVLGGGEFVGEQWLALRGTPIDIWPKLREFLKSKDYVMDLDDAELGVLETDWKEGEGEKHKVMIFTEPDQSGGTTLFLSTERKELSEGEWLDAEPDVDMEKKIIRKLSLYFHGTAVAGSGSIDSADSGSSTSSASPKPIKHKTEVLNVGDGKSYLAIPQEFTRAWRDTELVIQRAGYFIESKDQERGTYNFIYYKPKGEEKKSLLKKLKFWGNDEDEGTLYQLSLTGVGNKTEVIVMNEEGEWETGEDASVILNTLRDMYNKL